MSWNPRPSERTPLRIASRVTCFFYFDKHVANLLLLVLGRQDREIAGVGSVTAGASSLSTSSSVFLMASERSALPA